MNLNDIIMIVMLISLNWKVVLYSQHSIATLSLLRLLHNCLIDSAGTELLTKGRALIKLGKIRWKFPIVKFNYGEVPKNHSKTNLCK